jgi:peptidoglycan/xylan/chitin deacetylase (PgdA/CDA1 family)
MTIRIHNLSLHRFFKRLRVHHIRLLFVISVLGLTLPLLVKTLTSQPDQPVQLPTENVIGDGTMRRIYIPILMYHYVGQLPKDPDPYRVELTVSTQRFREHLEYLISQGYSSVSLYEVNNALLSGSPLPAKPIILTFDDGYRDHYENVFALLREFNLRGTFFVITGYADQGLSQYLSWAQIEEMAQQGMWIEPHTKSHIDLRERSREQLIYEIVGSVESIQAHTGQSGAIFAYPGGRYDNQTLSVIQDTPIRRAVTTQHGALLTSDNFYELPRLRVSGEMSVTALDQLLRSG